MSWFVSFYPLGERDFLFSLSFRVGEVRMTDSKTKLENYLELITESDYKTAAKVQKQIDGLVKPPGSLGRLETLATKVAAITGKTRNNLMKKCIIVFCSDNGVVAEGVASAPPSVTLMLALNCIQGRTGVNVLARKAKADVLVVDMGIDADIKSESIIDRKIRRGTWNIAHGPAMTYEEACQAVLTGIEMVELAKDKGYQVLGTGEMGIGNTTTSSAIFTAYSGLPTSKTVGKGAGLSEEMFEKKKKIVSQAIAVNKPNLEDPIDVLAKLGGFDIGALVGLYIGGAYYKLPVVMDGFISATAAMLALKLNEKVRDYILESHASAEPGFKELMKVINMKPFFEMEMRLGEGSGCPLTFMALDMACALTEEMATFGEAQIDEQYQAQFSKFEF
jgi:nicotinate-nucleotide--dimethylbenzimidazole phosphoribosyltransferase